MQDPAQPGALQDSEASNFEELELQVQDNDRRAGETDANQDDEDEAGAPLPSRSARTAAETNNGVCGEQEFARKRASSCSRGPTTEEWWAKWLRSQGKRNGAEYGS